MSAVYFGDLKNTSLTLATFVPAAALASATTFNGTGCDMMLGDAQNFNAVLVAGAYDITSGNETYAITITESSDNTTFTALPTPVSFTTKTAAGGDTGLTYVEVVFGQRSKRYLRAEITITGTSPSFLPMIVFMERKRITGSGSGYQA